VKLGKFFLQAGLLLLVQDSFNQFPMGCRPFLHQRFFQPLFFQQCDDLLQVLLQELLGMAFIGGFHN
jgi:hypothetical protein